MPETISQYTIKQGGFEGPLDLLLSLIEQHKLFVNEISLAEVTNDYVTYVKSISDIPTEKQIADVSYFVLVAATLILIKSKSLLPDLELTEDETEKITDLEQRLNLYRIIKNASLDIKNEFGLKIIFWPNDRIWGEPLFVPAESITTSSIGESISEVLANLPVIEEKKPEVEIKKIINLDQVINSLTARIQNAMNISFREFSKSHGAQNAQEEKIHVIVSFLAMLELVREGIIDVIQKTSFGDIEMNKQILIENQ
jgi:segregation and condensation protein A